MFLSVLQLVLAPVLAGTALNQFFPAGKFARHTCAPRVHRQLLAGSSARVLCAFVKA